MSALPIPRSRSAAVAVLVGCLAAAVPGTLAFGKSRNPASKVYVAEVEGLSDIDTGERIQELVKKTVYNAADSIIQTKAGSSSAIVFSNGTGAYLEPETTLRVEQFVQEPFLPNRTDLDVEPSISRMVLALTHGRVSLCTSRLVSGSSMELNTPHSVVNIRGKRIVVQTDETQTVVSLVEGDVTVRGGKLDGHGRTLKTGERAIIRPGLSPEPYEVVVEPIPEEDLPKLEDKVARACMARRTVYFDDGDNDPASNPFARAGVAVLDDEIRPVPKIPDIPDPPVFVSGAEISNPND